jgi:hypothetical protein
MLPEGPYPAVLLTPVAGTSVPHSGHFNLAMQASLCERTEMTSSDSDYENLLERYRRLRIAAQAVIEEATAVGTPEHPMCGVPPHAIRRVRRELDGEPQPQLDWMSIT